MREFCIGKCEFSIPDIPFVTYEKDTFAIIGEIFTLLSSMDPGESIMISCTDDDVLDDPEHFV